ncbi:hypothetical protein [Fimbriiglobus ruber]|uniref:Uncharacterized protein n=1 Tax=Fimbriiglobus ruber TaxID=1908690 RepID=A0A225E8L1_9BACT|nr:hypothetical protein [Fimbriiglobus ruber]OWK44955.1 hypothetical protein FRUB_01286 [Fimbriiglobus ruber]
MDERAVITDSHRSEVADEEKILRLIAGVGTEEIVVYDVSDCQLYGRKWRCRLSGAVARRAETAGYRPEVYQSVYWLTLVYLPVKPLGTFLVLPRQSCDDPDGDAEQYRALRLSMDWRQVVCHYVVAVLLVLGTIGVLLAWRSLRA